MLPLSDNALLTRQHSLGTEKGRAARLPLRLAWCGSCLAGSRRLGLRRPPRRALRSGRPACGKIRSSAAALAQMPAGEAVRWLAPAAVVRGEGCGGGSHRSATPRAGMRAGAPRKPIPLHNPPCAPGVRLRASQDGTRFGETEHCPINWTMTRKPGIMRKEQDRHMKARPSWPIQHCEGCKHLNDEQGMKVCSATVDQFRRKEAVPCLDPGRPSTATTAST